MTILAKAPVREAFAACSSGNGDHSYYDNKGYALQRFDAALAEYGLSLDDDELYDYNGDEGRTQHHVRNAEGEIVGCAIFTYYKMGSGRWEFIGYLA